MPQVFIKYHNCLKNLKGSRPKRSDIRYIMGFVFIG